MDYRGILSEHLRGGIPPARQKFIRCISNDEWVDHADQDEVDELSEEWERRAADFLKDCTDPIELHLFVETFNADGGIEDIVTALANECCERATALLVFWRYGGDYFQRYSSEDEVSSHERRSYGLIRSLEKRIVSGEFKVGRISYSPLQDGARLRRKAKWKPDRTLFAAVDGAIPVSDGAG